MMRTRNYALRYTLVLVLFVLLSECVLISEEVPLMAKVLRNISRRMGQCGLSVSSTSFVHVTRL
jgi:hypothetical protein